MMSLDESECEFIDRSKIGRFATCYNGIPHVIPVSPVLEKESCSIYFVTDYNTKKLRNLKLNPKVAIVFDEYGSGASGIMVLGDASYIERGSEYRKVRAMLYDKFPQYFKAELYFDEGEAPIVRVIPQSSVSWGLTK